MWNLNTKSRGKAGKCIGRRLFGSNQGRHRSRSPEGVGRGHKVGGRQAGLRVGSLGSSEKQYMWLGFVDLVVDPSSGLLDSDVSPLRFREQFTLVGYFFVDFLGQDDVAVLVEIVEVLLGVLDLAGVVRHNIYINSRLYIHISIPPWYCIQQYAQTYHYFLSFSFSLSFYAFLSSS